jgi:hypothetical protein
MVRLDVARPGPDADCAGSSAEDGNEAQLRAIPTGFATLQVIDKGPRFPSKELPARAGLTLARRMPDRGEVESGTGRSSRPRLASIRAEVAVSQGFVEVRTAGSPPPCETAAHPGTIATARRLSTIVDTPCNLLDLCQRSLTVNESV